jgi:hypothetical protein
MYLSLRAKTSTFGYIHPIFLLLVFCFEVAKMDEMTKMAIDLAWLLWRSIWHNSSQDWSPYRRRIWDMYTVRLRSAARMSRDLGEFVSLFCRAFSIPTPGASPEERAHLQMILDLPSDAHDKILQCFHLQLPVITLYVRLRRDAAKTSVDNTFTDVSDEDESSPTLPFETVL